MNAREAKEILLLYRGPVDDADPQFREALAHVQRDPELAKWLREQTRCYDAIRAKLRELEPPVDLSRKIIRTRPIPFGRKWNEILKLAAAIIVSASITALGFKLSERKRHSIAQGHEILVKGEVLDMTCYIAYNLSGPEHASCARDCIRNGLPVGIKAEDGKVYLLTGNAGKSVNAELADYAAKVVTIKGKESIRDGFAQLQVEEIRKFY
ncbi:MAG: hypothetical protein DME99_11865 [Verrucomicrobia bacterium]|nr:MAG: hypothetical protein DME99_11865 [Verrucomicrobiota bacterium]